MEAATKHKIAFSLRHFLDDDYDLSSCVCVSLDFLRTRKYSNNLRDACSEKSHRKLFGMLVARWSTVMNKLNEFGFGYDRMCFMQYAYVTMRIIYQK